MSLHVYIYTLYIQGVLKKLLVQTSHTDRKYVFKHFFFNVKTSNCA